MVYLSSWQRKMSRGWYFVKNFWTRITSVFFLGLHYHRICHQLNIYWMRQKLSCSMEVCGVQKRVSPPLAATTASHLRRIEPINRWIKACWMLFYSCTSGSCLSMICSDNDVEQFCWYCLSCYAHMNLNYTIFVDLFSLWRLPSSSHICSIGDRSGDNAGQERTRMWFCFRKSGQTRVTWHLALSCWKTLSKFRCCRKGRTIGSRKSSLYFTVF
jgi:hypothetical protein